MQLISFPSISLSLIRGDQKLEGCFLFYFKELKTPPGVLTQIRGSSQEEMSKKSKNFFSNGSLLDLSAIKGNREGNMEHKELPYLCRIGKDGRRCFFHLFQL